MCFVAGLYTGVFHKYILIYMFSRHLEIKHVNMCVYMSMIAYIGRRLTLNKLMSEPVPNSKRKHSSTSFCMFCANWSHLLYTTRTKRSIIAFRWSWLMGIYLHLQIPSRLGVDSTTFSIDYYPWVPTTAPDPFKIFIHLPIHTGQVINGSAAANLGRRSEGSDQPTDRDTDRPTDRPIQTSFEIRPRERRFADYYN